VRPVVLDRIGYSQIRLKRIRKLQATIRRRVVKQITPGNVAMSGKESRAVSGGLHRMDRLLGGDQEPPMGSHLITPRRGYLHHGIYIGDRKVVHYSGLAQGLRRGPVEEVALAAFACGQRIWVRTSAPPDFDVREVIYRARSRVGEDCYRLLTNNCEHFCEWCLHGKARSLQVEALLAWPRRAVLAALRLVAPLSFEGSHPQSR
jgi:hypothetical protein